MILINSKFISGENEWLGIVQTLKTHIKSNVVEKLKVSQKIQDKCYTKVFEI